MKDIDFDDRRVRSERDKRQLPQVDSKSKIIK